MREGHGVLGIKEDYAVQILESEAVFAATSFSDCPF